VRALGWFTTGTRQCCIHSAVAYLMALLSRSRVRRLFRNVK
jgi:hypothetical protein